MRTFEHPNLPTPAGGLLEKGPVGVHGDGVADRLEHREVGDRVGVGKRTVEIEVVAFGFFDDGGDLVFAGGIELDLARVLRSSLIVSFNSDVGSAQ